MLNINVGKMLESEKNEPPKAEEDKIEEEVKMRLLEFQTEDNLEPP